MGEGGKQKVSKEEWERKGYQVDGSHDGIRSIEAHEKNKIYIDAASWPNLEGLRRFGQDHRAGPVDSGGVYTFVSVFV